MTNKQLYFGRGKLLLTGEYFVLDGATALALPTKLGQQMEVVVEEYNGANVLQWQAFDSNGKIWFEAQLSPKKYHIIEASDKATAVALQTILRSVQSDSHFIPENKITKVKTELDFPTDWGLGSSSTLIYMIARWAKMDPFRLLKNTFGGSGYDIACASEEQPLLFQLLKDKSPHWETIPFSPSFKNQLYFVYLGKKQSSRKGIKHYREIVKHPQKYISLVNQITQGIIRADNLNDFERLLTEHELLISKVLKFQRSKNIYFEDYEGGIVKSLGAWGGDFVLATSSYTSEKTQQYFNSKGFEVVLPYKKLIV